MSIRLAFAVLLGFAACAFAGETSVEIVNNQPFDICMPIRLRGVPLNGAARGTSERGVVQKLGDDVVIIADVTASKSKVTKVVEGEAPAPAKDLELAAVSDGISFRLKGKELGSLAWDVIVRPAEKPVDMPASTKRDFDATFKPLAVKFERTAQGALFDTWTAQAEKDGVALAFELHAYHAGFLDVTANFTNRSAATKGVYCAVLCRWEQPTGDNSVVSRTVNYNNEITPLTDGKYTLFREGTERHLYVQRGVDWINTSFSSGACVAWLNDFTPSFTVHKDATAKTPARWIGANTAQLAQEAQAKGNKVYSITEIARPQIKSYRSRVEDDVLPQPGDDALPITSRLVFSDVARSDERVDEYFIALTSYRHQEKTEQGIRLTLGVPFTKFGTAYFPYSTLGENFIGPRLTGMSKEGYWPLAAETVNQWKLFADDIKRDLRIMKSMGYEITRLHHLELLWETNPATKKPYIEAAKRQEYLDFFFGELKYLGLKALLDVKLSPEETAELVKRYHDQVEGVEIDNEVILFMLPDADVPYWKAVYEAVKKVDPKMPVHLTGHTNTGAFNRLRKFGVPFDKVGSHAYMDAIEAIPSARDYALAVADYASELNVQPEITEWNWRFLTRMPFDARAKIYPPIYENVLKTRSMPTIYQFQFQDTLAMNWTGLKGMRHYDQLLLSRRPKPEALEFEKLMRRYERKDHPNQLLNVPMEEIQLDENGAGKFEFDVTCPGTVRFAATVESSSDVEVKTPSPTLTILTRPAVNEKVPVRVSLKDGKDAKPGFYHIFLRAETVDGQIRYAWAYARKPGAPQIDKTMGEKPKVAYGEGALDFDFNRPLTVVYRKGCDPLELEGAWCLFVTLESATGRPVEIYQDDDPRAHIKERGRILVGAGSAVKGPTVKMDGTDKLIVDGSKPDEVIAAAMDLTIRYWKFAKDSASRRVGLVEQPSGKAGVKTDLE